MAHGHDHPHVHDENVGHEHGHLHAHAAGNPNFTFGLGITLNLSFVVVEIIGGLLAHSTALVADATHNLGDVLGLVLAWIATALARRSPSARRTYGLRRTTILAALANAVILLVAVGGLIWESIGRIRHP